MISESARVPGHESATAAVLSLTTASQNAQHRSPKSIASLHGARKELTLRLDGPGGTQGTGGAELVEEREVGRRWS